MRTILLMNGPNLDLLGVREPEVYGTSTLADLETLVADYAAKFGIAVSRYQSNSEGDLITALHCAPSQFDGIIYNPGAHTHYSYALRDAIAGIGIPVVEVHLSDVSNREAFRRVSVIAPACVAQIKGLGFDGYCRAVDVLCGLKELTRLGEGYESQFPEEEPIKVAGPAVLSGLGAALAEDASESALVAEAPNPEPVPAEAESPEAGLNEEASVESIAAEPEDFTAAFAQGIASENRAAVSMVRQQLVRDACKQLQVDAFLVRDTSNIRWIMALDDAFDEERAHALLVTEDGACIHTDSRYSNAIRLGLARMGSNVEVSEEHVGHMAFARSVLAERGGTFGRMAIEDTITYAEYVKAVEALGISGLAASTDTVVGLRAVKTQEEIQRLKAAQAVTDAAFTYIVSFMRPGMTEREVQLELENYMLRHGAEGLAFSSIVAAGANGADPHAIPGKTRLEAGQCVVMDFGAKAYGYCSDMTRVVFLGEPSARLADAWNVLRLANETVEAQLRPGMTGKEAHELAERVLTEGGYEGKMGHGLGHGVGLDIHEQPVLSTRNDKPLVAGNVVTVEPGIYVPGEFGMRLEDCGVLTEGGYEVFSTLGHEMVVV